MISDEELYRQYLSGDETGLEELMKKYGNPLTLYINGYLHDIHAVSYTHLTLPTTPYV